MPYIKPQDRARLDPLIDDLAAQIVMQGMQTDNESAFAGLLNYSFTRLAMKVIKLQFGKIRYWIINAVMGVFQSAAAEFYRRVGVPYEDRQIQANGDVDLYAEFHAENLLDCVKESKEIS